MRVGVWECLCSSQMHFSELSFFFRAISSVTWKLARASHTACTLPLVMQLSPIDNVALARLWRDPRPRGRAHAAELRTIVLRSTPGSSRPASTWPTVTGATDDDDDTVHVKNFSLC